MSEAEATRSVFPFWYLLGLLLLAAVGLSVLLIINLGPRKTIDRNLIRPDGAILITNAIGLISNQNPCFSPDGKQLVFTHWEHGYNRGPATLVLLDLATRKEHILLAERGTDNANVPGRCWSAGTGEIVFSSDRGGGFDEIWSIDLDTRQAKQITVHDEPKAYLEPVLSPDDRWLAYQSSDLSGDDERQFGQIVLAPADGSGARTLPGAETAITDDRLPNWSHDGRLLFQRRFLKPEGGWGNWEVFTSGLNEQGNWSAPQNITNAPNSEETDSSWSPDGRWIISSSDYGGLTQPAIWAFPIDGGEPVRLTQDLDHEEGAPVISPDGQWLAFESHRTSDEESPSDLWLLPLADQLKK